MIPNLTACNTGNESLDILNDLIDEHNNEKANLDAPIFVNGIQVSTGDLAVGNLTPIARANFFGGSAAKALLYFEPQPTYTGAIYEGLVWNDSSKKSIVEQQLIGNKILSGTLINSIVDSNTNFNNNGLTLFTGVGYQYTIPANSLVVGKKLVYTLKGRYGTTAIGPTLRLRSFLNASTISDTQNTTLSPSQNNQGFEIVIEITVITLGITGTIKVNGNFKYTTSTGTIIEKSISNVTNKTINTTVSNLLNFASKWSGPTNIANTITGEMATLEVKN